MTTASFDGFKKTGIDGEIEDASPPHCETYGISPLDAVRHFAVLARRQLLKRFLAHTELFKLTLDVPGDIAELGVFRGLGLMTWANLLEAYCVGDRTKTVHGFDNWSGFVGFSAGGRRGEREGEQGRRRFLTPNPLRRVARRDRDLRRRPLHSVEAADSFDRWEYRGDRRPFRDGQPRCSSLPGSFRLRPLRADEGRAHGLVAAAFAWRRDAVRRIRYSRLAGRDESRRRVHGGQTRIAAADLFLDQRARGLVGETVNDVGAFHERGYLIVENALDVDVVERVGAFLTAAADAAARGEARPEEVERVRSGHFPLDVRLSPASLGYSAGGGTGAYSTSVFAVR